MVWTAPRTFVSGEVETAAIFNTHLRDNLSAINGFVKKTADQSVTSSTVLVNDTELLYAIPAAGTYLVECHLWGRCAADPGGDINLAFSFPSGTFHFGGNGPDISLPAAATIEPGQWAGYNTAVSGTSTLPFGLSATATPAHIYMQLFGELIASASGTLRLMWAQQASSANASTLKAGSFMTVKQVA